MSNVIPLRPAAHVPPESAEILRHFDALYRHMMMVQASMDRSGLTEEISVQIGLFLAQASTAVFQANLLFIDSAERANGIHGQPNAEPGLISGEACGTGESLDG